MRHPVPQELIRIFIQKHVSHAQVLVNNVSMSQQYAAHAILLSTIHKFFTTTCVTQLAHKVLIKLEMSAQIVIQLLLFVKVVIFRQLIVLLANPVITFQVQIMVHAAYLVPVPHTLYRIVLITNVWIHARIT